MNQDPSSFGASLFWSDAPTPSDDSMAVSVAGLLATLLMEPPTEDTLRAIAAAPVAEPLDGAILDAVRSLTSEAAAVDPQDASREYVRLFLNPRGAPVSPWESAWTEVPPQLWGAPHHQMLALYARAGKRLATELNEAADHIAMELAFLAFLREGARETPDYRVLSRIVWEEHLARWVPRFAAALEREARLPLFIAAGKALRLTSESRQGNAPPAG
ncbi:MAG: TorD/DmsD family molecular chaperone [Thermoanaerobaculia bacterium]